MVDNQIAAISEEWNCADFWQQWQQYQDYLYNCCLKWMNGNFSDAEDALSRAMLKAWEKAQKFAGKITNFKSWLTKLTHNLCVDIHREYKRGSNRVEDIEAIGEDKALFLEDTALNALETDEKEIAIRSAIDNLHTRLRETFILHFYQQLSHQEIVEEQGISYQNVCKRISQARKILREELRGYLIGDLETNTELSVSPGGMELVKEEIVHSVAVEEVETVVEAPQEVAESKQDSEGKLEVKSDHRRYVEINLGQFDEEFSCWGNFWLPLVQQQLFVEKFRNYLIRSSLNWKVKNKHSPDEVQKYTKNMPVQNKFSFSDLPALDSSPADVRKKFQEHFGAEPDGIAVNNETYFNAVNPAITETYGHPCYKTLGEFSFTEEPNEPPNSAVVATSYATNQGDDEITIEQEVGGSWSESTTWSCSVTAGLTFSEEVGVEGVFKQGIEFSVSVTAGRSGTSQQTRTARSSVTVKVPPKSKRKIEMIATLQKMKMKYEAPIEVQGSFGANFPYKVQGHYFWFRDARAVLPETSGKMSGIIEKTAALNTQIKVHLSEPI